MSAITIDLPDSLYEKLKEVAAKDKSTAEHLAVVAIAEKLSAFMTVEYLQKRASGRSLGALKSCWQECPT